MSNDKKTGLGGLRILKQQASDSTPGPKPTGAQSQAPQPQPAARRKPGRETAIPGGQALYAKITPDAYTLLDEMKYRRKRRNKHITLGEIVSEAIELLAEKEGISLLDIEL